MVQGVENRVAFEVTDQHGEAQNVKGVIVGDATVHSIGVLADAPANASADRRDQEIRTEYMGRGSFVVTPGTKRLKARFTWRDKEWTVDLPKAEAKGIAMRLEGDRLMLNCQGLPADKEYGLSVLCRGKLVHFAPCISSASSPMPPQQATTQQRSETLTTNVQVRLPLDDMPTGINDVTVFDSEGRIWADRLCFVNHHDYDGALITSAIKSTDTYEPYQKIEVPVQLNGITEPTTFSISIHDTNTDEPTYDDGNIMTDMLLSSDLRGFIAYPAHYFEADDEVHQRHLDLLMMVQGWRKYKWKELTDTEREMRYKPETTLTLEGAVYKTLGVNDVEPDEVSSWQDGVGMIARKSTIEDELSDPFAQETEEQLFISTDAVEVSENEGVSDIDYGSIGSANDHLGVNHGNLRHEVIVEAEISVDGKFVGGTERTKDGRFLFQIPPFYGSAYLNMKAYKENDSIVKNMASRKDKKVLESLLGKLSGIDGLKSVRSQNTTWNED